MPTYLFEKEHSPLFHHSLSAVLIRSRHKPSAYPLSILCRHTADAPVSFSTRSRDYIGSLWGD
ncbi:MAG: hypothetical protein SOY26_03890 [Paludibacteraceae bacterium]|nr:hypothetical protein [Paludibacteraceae bacterium]